MLRSGTLRRPSTLSLWELTEPLTLTAMSKSAVKISQDLLSNPLCEQDQDFLRMVTALDTAMKRMDAFNQEKVTRSCCQWSVLLTSFPLDLATCSDHKSKVVLDFNLLKPDSLKPISSQTSLLRCPCFYAYSCCALQGSAAHPSILSH